jgi:hypothetical protein
MATTSGAALERMLKVSVSGLEPAQIAKVLADFARKGLAEALEDGSGSPRYKTIVNGRVGASEDTVSPPGPIVYQFDWLLGVKAYALSFLEQRAPIESGHYRRSFVAMANGRVLGPDDEPPIGAELIITNPVPYSRKIEVGAMRRMRVPPGVFEAARQGINRRYGNLVKCELQYLALPGAWRLKTGSRRKGRRAGDVVTAPSLVINLRSAV